MELLSIVIGIRSSQSLCTVSNLSRPFSKGYQPDLCSTDSKNFNMVSSMTGVHAQSSTFFSLNSFLCFTFGFVDNKLKTIFLSTKETCELPQQCRRIHHALPHSLVSLRHSMTQVPVLLLRVSKANLFWLLKSTVIAHICASVRSCWLNAK